MHAIKYRHKRALEKELLSNAGFTFIELLVVVGVIAILFAVSVPSYEAFRKKASKAVCISRMRVIHVALDNHMIDNKQWPQMPDAIFYAEGEQGDTEFWKWWIATMDPYGAGDTHWLCPADVVRKESKVEYNGSYMPTKFDEHNFTPYRWAGQPWLIERGDFHKKGAHIMMLDGSIQNSQSVY